MHLIFSGYVKIGDRKPKCFHEEMRCPMLHTDEHINTCVKSQPPFSQGAGTFNFTLTTEAVQQMSLAILRVA